MLRKVLFVEERANERVVYGFSVLRGADQFGFIFYRSMAEGKDQVVPDESAVNIDNNGYRNTSLYRSELRFLYEGGEFHRISSYSSDDLSCCSFVSAG